MSMKGEDHPPPPPHTTKPDHGESAPAAEIPVVAAPPMYGAPSQVLHPVWSTGLFDCFSDMNSCCLVFWCPCVAFGQIAEIVDRGTTPCWVSGAFYLLLCSLSMPGSEVIPPMSLQWILSCVYRSKLKQRSNIPPDCIEECCTHFWCEPCAICQEYRELKNQGYDLTLGWEANAQKRGGAADASAMVPMVTAPAAQSMHR